MKDNIFFRVDGDSEIGLGHLTRCFALASMLHRSFNIHFVSIKTVTSFIRDVKNIKWVYHIVKNENSFFRLLNARDIVVIDHYHVKSNHQKQIKEVGCKLVCIDDLCRSYSYADIIINHAPGIIPDDYRCPIYTQYFLGPNYSLLRKPFTDLSLKRSVKKSLRRQVFICFGGADPKDLTSRCLKIISNNSWVDVINVVVGASYKNVNQLKRIICSDSRIKLYNSVDDKTIAKLLKESNLVVVPASSILIEALCSSATIISGYYAFNQKSMYQNYLLKQSFIDAGNFSVKKIEKAFQSFDHANLVEKKVPIIDGLSPIRLQKIFQGLQNEMDIKLENANANHLSTTFNWSQDNIVRQFSFSQKKITIEEHTSWFFSKIKDPLCIFYIAFYKNSPIGSIRFDKIDGEAVISYLVDSAHHNFGFGSAILRLGLEKFVTDNRFYINKIVGFVIKENIASIKAFERLGFRNKIDTVDKKIKFYKEI